MVISGKGSMLMTDAGDHNAAASSDDSERDWSSSYGELRDIALRLLNRERRDHTLQPTALVHEVFVRFQRDQRFEHADQAQIMAHAVRAMRDILIEHARKKKASKRGGGADRVPLDDALAAFEERAIDLLALDDAINELAAMDPPLAQLVQLRFFGGYTEAEAAEHLGMSLRTASRSWRIARSWLAKRLGEHHADEH